MSRDFSNLEIGLAERAQGLERFPLLGRAFIAIREKTNGCPDSDQFVWVKWGRVAVSNVQGETNRDWVESRKDPGAGLLKSTCRNAIVLSVGGDDLEEAIYDGNSTAAVVYDYRGKSHAAVLTDGLQPIGKESDDRFGAGFRMGRTPAGFMLATVNNDTGLVTALPDAMEVEQFAPTSEFNSSGRYPGVPLV